MPASRALIGRRERGADAYWPARGGAFDSAARTPSTRQNLARETAPFTCRRFRSLEARVRGPRARGLLNPPLVPPFPCRPPPSRRFTSRGFTSRELTVSLRSRAVSLDSESGCRFSRRTRVQDVETARRRRASSGRRVEKAVAATLRILRSPPGVVTCFHCDRALLCSASPRLSSALLLLFRGFFICILRGPPPPRFLLFKLPRASSGFLRLASLVSDLSSSIFDRPKTLRFFAAPVLGACLCSGSPFAAS